MKVTILGGERPVTVETDGSQSLLELLRSQQLAPEAPCGGRGSCGKCCVKVDGAVSAPDECEAEAVASGKRLACRCYPVGECTVNMDHGGSAVICTTGSGRSFPVSARDGLGAALDIGTTTVVLYLHDLRTGARLSTQSEMNLQRSFGADVISRISWCSEHEDGLATLASAVRGQVAKLLVRACDHAGRDPKQVVRLAIAGNTVMEHFFAGISPQSIAVAPFLPAELFGGEVDGLKEFAEQTVWLAPCVAGYVGGDITAGLLASGASCDEGPCLFLDVGTNGEMALIQEGCIVSCATAAGPAFEGAEISCGMMAQDGAIDKVWFENGLVHCKTIGGIPAKGICGSGLVDALAVMLDLGAVDETGRLLPAAEAPDEARAYLAEDESGVRFLLENGVSVSAADVRKLQLAKAAIAAGIATLLTERNLPAEKLTALYLAGGFGSYLNKDSAARIGLFPACLTDKLIACGNSAGAGASAALCSDAARAELRELAAKVEYLELSGNRVFSDSFIDAMEFEAHSK